MTKRRAIALGLFVLATAAGGTWWWTQRPKARTEPLTIYGNVDIRTAQLAFDGQAIVATMRVEEGARVQAGDVLATLDASRINAELAEAAAQVGAREAVLSRLEAGTRKQEIEQARARVKSAEAKLANAEENVTRLIQTSATGASSQQRLDDATSLVTVEQANLNEARQALDLALEGPRQEDIAEARAQVEAARAHVLLLRDRLTDTELLAPSAGTIRSRLLEPGDYATPGRAVYVLALNDPKWVRAYVPEPSLGKVRHGARASVRSDSSPDQLFEGWVGFISPVAEFTPKTVETSDLRTQLVYEVRVYVSDPEDRLRLGMPTTVVVDEESPPTGTPAPSAQVGPAMATTQVGEHP